MKFDPSQLNDARESYMPPSFFSETCILDKVIVYLVNVHRENKLKPSRSNTPFHMAIVDVDQCARIHIQTHGPSIPIIGLLFSF